MSRQVSMRAACALRETCAPPRALDCEVCGRAPEAAGLNGCCSDHCTRALRELVVVEGSQDKGWEIASMIGGVAVPVARAVDRALAHAMAAAPHLLEASRRFLATLEADAAECTCERDDICPLCHVRAAIARATPDAARMAAREVRR